MNDHIYGAIKKQDYPIERHEELRALLPYSNLCTWQFTRKESDDDFLGTDYVGIEEESITDETKDYLESLKFVIVGNSELFNTWRNLYGQINDNAI
jgi:hypothetical protein